jgi:hypothetical protein
MSDPVLPWGSLDPEQLLEGTSVGEWKVGKSGGPYVYCEGRAVCIIDEWPDVAEPNCRLIAAAPTLARMVKVQQDVIARWLGGWEWVGGWEADDREELDIWSWWRPDIDGDGDRVEPMTPDEAACIRAIEGRQSVDRDDESR